MRLRRHMGEIRSQANVLTRARRDTIAGTHARRAPCVPRTYACPGETRDARYQPVYGVRGVVLGCGAAELSARHDRTCVGRRGDRWGANSARTGAHLGRCWLDPLGWRWEAEAAGSMLRITRACGHSRDSNAGGTSIIRDRARLAFSEESCACDPQYASRSVRVYRGAWRSTWAGRLGPYQETRSESGTACSPALMLPV